ncbi:DUF5641 domain-containing protein [Trichonephila clavipes]|nr:DUF5641 domain-containing protein [Trichonephila clavipes]
MQLLLRIREKYWIVGGRKTVRKIWKKCLEWPLAHVIKLIPGKDGLERTAKLKAQSYTSIRSIKRVFPLEVSGNDVTRLPLQKVQQTDSSMNYPDPDILKATVKPQVTRCGQPMKKPDKLNLLTLTDVFEQMKMTPKEYLRWGIAGGLVNGTPLG